MVSTARSTVMAADAIDIVDATRRVARSVNGPRHLLNGYQYLEHVTPVESAHGNVAEVRATNAGVVFGPVHT